MYAMCEALITLGIEISKVIDVMRLGIPVIGKFIESDRLYDFACPQRTLILKREVGCFAYRDLY
jgi:hypothetical protein